MSTSTLFDLDGRVALVTGATRGIGLATAQGLAAAGARVAVCARTAEACEEVAAEIERTGGEAHAVPANVGRPEQVPAVLDAVVARWGRIDILVNNAGVNAEWAAATDFTDKAYDKTFSVNVRAPLVLTREAVRAGLGKGGSVINMVSIAGLKSEPFMALYSASKAALVSATKTMARELGPAGIRVNAVAPGVIRTDFSKLLVETPSIHDRVVETTALGRVGEPEEIAGAVVWLASEAASYVTGSVIVVDGGLLA